MGGLTMTLNAIYAETYRLQYKQTVLPVQEKLYVQQFLNGLVYYSSFDLQQVTLLHCLKWQCTEHFSTSFLFKSPLQPSSVPLSPLPLSLCLWSGNILPTAHCSPAAHFVWQHLAVDLPVVLLVAQLAEPADPATHTNIT
jgi:hypothetical protein